MMWLLLLLASPAPSTLVLRTDVPQCALSWVKPADKTGTPDCALLTFAACEVQPLVVDGRVEAHLLLARAPVGQCSALARFGSTTAQRGQWIFEGPTPAVMPPLVTRPAPTRTAAMPASASHHRLPLSLDARFLGVEGRLLLQLLDAALHAAAPAVNSASPSHLAIVDGRPVVEIDAAWSVDVVRQALLSARDRPVPVAFASRFWAAARLAIAWDDMPVGAQAKRRAEQWWWTGAAAPQRFGSAPTPTDDETWQWLRAHLNPEAVVPRQ